MNLKIVDCRIEKLKQVLTENFLEYEFTVENLDLFTGYGKIGVMNSSNQAQAPRFSRP